jgi:hypothetical protein
MKNLSKIIALVFIVLGVNSVKAQNSLKADEAHKAIEVKKLIKSGRYTFKATKMISKNGDNRSLRQGDNLDISKDTLIAYLPDLGKAPMTPVRAHDAGITCTNFRYNKTSNKSGGWDITIEPKGKSVMAAKDVRKIDMAVSKQGYATLTLTFSNHSPVAFYGYIKQHSAVFPQTNAVAVN